MGLESEGKAERILSIYSRLKEGHVVCREEISEEYGVTARTVYRDITDIQNFLQNHSSLTGEIQEIVYDKRRGGYMLQTKADSQIRPRELLAVCKIMLESRALVKEEMFPILRKLSGMCGTDGKPIAEYIGNEMHHYIELRHGKRILDTLWTLERAVNEQRYVKIRYQKLKNRETVTRVVKPVGVMFSEFYFYLTAFIEDIDKEKAFQNPDDPFPTIYRMDRLEGVELLDGHFSIPYAERFEEGEFRKRVQFMYGGSLQRVKFRYYGSDINAVLDRLPTAEILSEKDGVYTVAAEVFGKGIDMWLRSQGENVEVF